MAERPKRHYAVRFRRVGDRYIVASGSKTFELEAVAARIWEMCDGRHNPTRMASEIASMYDVDGETAGRDVRDFLDELEAEGLIRYIES